MWCGIFFIFVIGVIVAGFVFSIKMADETKKKWNQAARELKLRYMQGAMFNPGVITGNFKGNIIKIDTISKGSGNNSKTYTRFRVDFAKPANFHFRMTRQNFLSNLGKAFGMEDVEIGDPSFDNKVVVQSQNRAMMMEYLTPERRELIKKSMASFPDVVVTNKYIQADVGGTLSNPRLIKSHVQWLGKFADGMDLPKKRKVPKEDRDNKPKKVTPKSDFGVIDAKVNKEKHQQKPLIEKEVKSPEVEVVEIAPQEKVEPVVRELPEVTKPKEIDKEQEVAVSSEIDKKPEMPKSGISKPVFQSSMDSAPEKIKSSIEETPAAVEEEKVLPEKKGSMTVESFSHEIFDSKLGTFDSTKLFEEKYMNTAVKWEGTLISANEFSYDFVFKNTTGVKATYEIMELESGYSKTKVKAVVHYPKDQLDQLKSSLNQKLKFSGKLVSVDGLVKNIFVAEGKQG